MPDFTQVNGARVTYTNGASVRGQRVAQFVCHRDGPRGNRFAVTLPCGACLGAQYPTLDAAKAAAADMAPLVKDWTASDLYNVFGDELTARRAYDLARNHMQGR